jgi:hypothetical protein
MGSNFSNEAIKIENFKLIKENEFANIYIISLIISLSWVVFIKNINISIFVKLFNISEIWACVPAVILEIIQHVIYKIWLSFCSDIILINIGIISFFNNLSTIFIFYNTKLPIILNDKILLLIFVFILFNTSLILLVTYSTIISSWLF